MTTLEEEPPFAPALEQGLPAPPNRGRSPTALESAAAAGLPVKGLLALERHDLQGSAAEVIERVALRLAREEPWREFETADRHSGLLPSLAVSSHGHGGDGEWLIRLATGDGAGRRLAEDVVRLVLPASTGLEGVSLSLRPAAWLALGFEVFTAAHRPGRGLIWGRVASVGGALQFSVAAPEAVESLGARLAAQWPFAFEAQLAFRNSGAWLIDASMSADSGNANARALADHPDPASAMELVSNSAPRAAGSLSFAGEVLASGQAQGHRWASGPLATSLETAIRFADAGRAPILVLEQLLPSQGEILGALAGLALRQDGPASHITILARTSGLPVLSRVAAECAAWPADGTIVTLAEAQRVLVLGEVQPEPSPASRVASSLTRDGQSPVAITTVKSSTVRAPIGLCRSEMQILGSPEGHLFVAYLAAVAEGCLCPELPAEVAQRLEASLEHVLSGADGVLLNYRLMDADLGEVLSGARVARAAVLRGMRGPRWALASGFYAWQIDMAVRAAAHQQMAGASVDLVLTLPSAFDLAEVRATRRLFDAALDTCPQARGGLRFGVMIETPRLCAQAENLPALAEVFCFGLNDLTALSHGLERDAWTRLEAFYATNGLAAGDPFSELDPVAVAPLVRSTIEILRRSGAAGPIFLCGEPANSRLAHASCVQSTGLFVSVAEGDWPSAVLSCARERARAAGAPALVEDWSVGRTRRLSRRAAAAARAGDTDLAATLALDWLSGAAPLAGDDTTRNWKVLKKWLVAALFGELQGRFIAPGWDPADVAAYACELLPGPATIRMSAFPSGISCHARSEVLDRGWDNEQVNGFVAGFDRAAALHVFPQQDADQLCFRAVFTQEGVVVEAGWGQAMYVFEAERGQHPIVTARATTQGPFQIDEAENDPRVRRGLQGLITAKSAWLHGVARGGAALLGLEHFAIEAYFDPRKPDRVAVVDIDLPLDIAWNTGA
jgi:hypothetical protein